MAGFIDWSWKQAVAERVLRIVNEKHTTAFSIDDIYSFSKELSELFPRNKHIREKIRQTLQRLRNDDFLAFHGGGLYHLNLAYQELQIEPAGLEVQGTETPPEKHAVRRIRLRNTLLAGEMKRRYKNICQVCRDPVLLRAGRFYSEAHHLKPLGSPYFGPDVLGNIIVLCPNHHAMFDHGAATIVPNTLLVRHIVRRTFPANLFLYVEPWHRLRPKCLQFHHFQIFDRESSAIPIVSGES